MVPGGYHGCHCQCAARMNGHEHQKLGRPVKFVAKLNPLYHWQTTTLACKSRAPMSALPQNAAAMADVAGRRKSATSGCEQQQQSDPLFNQLVAKGEPHRRNHLGRFAVFRLITRSNSVRAA
jgi:hypothetical protein